MLRLVVWGPLTGDAIQWALLENEGRGELPRDDGRCGGPGCLTTPTGDAP